MNRYFTKRMKSLRTWLSRVWLPLSMWLFCLGWTLVYLRREEIVLATWSYGASALCVCWLDCRNRYLSLRDFYERLP